MMWPTLASLLEERLSDDPRATHIVVHAFNRWMLDEWTFNFDERIFPTPIIAMNIVDEAIRELDYVVENGARAVLIRPAPVPDFNGRRRSFALEEFDPFWAKVQEAGVLVGMHASDDGQQRYMNEWSGREASSCRSPGGPSAFDAVLYSRPPGHHRRRHVDHRPRTRFPVPRHPVHAGRERQRVGATVGEAHPEGPRTSARTVRRGSARGDEAIDLRPPVPRGGPDRPHRTPRGSTTWCSDPTIRTRRACSIR